MLFQNAKYYNEVAPGNQNEAANIQADLDGVRVIIPIAPGNRHYDEIMKQVAAGTLTIQDAD